MAAPGLNAPTLQLHAVRGALTTAAGLLLISCGGSTPTQPTTPTPSRTVLQISGSTTVGTGGTIQLSATLTTNGVTSAAPNATWISQSPQVATVSPTGLVTGVSAGQSLISATANGTTGQTFVTVQPPPNGTTVLTTCSAITASGSYTVANDLVGNANCIPISNVTNVHLDCGGHIVSGLQLRNASGVTITNCSVTGQTGLSSVMSSTFTRCVLSSLVLDSSQSVTVSDSTITSGTNTSVYSRSGNDVEFLRDVVSNTGSGLTIAGAFYFVGGANNHVEQTTISSGYDGGPLNVGADDGILLFSETGDTIRGNTISGFFDTGVEGVGTLANTTIADNTISNVGYTAIGSYYCTNWTNDVVQGNHASLTPALLYIEYVADASHCGSPIAPPAFTGNQFIGNVFRSPIFGTLESHSPAMVVALGGSPVSGNLIQNNDFAAFDGPFLNPLDGFIDGGGNICGPLNPVYSNFACTGSSMSRRGRVTGVPLH